MMNQFNINIYSIQRKILSVLTAAKSKSKSKLKLNSESIDSDNNDNNDEIKKKIYLQNNSNMTLMSRTSQC